MLNIRSTLHLMASLLIFIACDLSDPSDEATAKLEQQDLMAQEHCEIHCDLFERCAPKLLESMHGSVEKCHESCLPEKRQAKCLENCTKSPENFDLEAAAECESICKVPTTKDESIEKCRYLGRYSKEPLEEGCQRAWRMMGTEQCLDGNEAHMECLKALTCDAYVSQLTRSGPPNCLDTAENVGRACGTDWM